MLDHTVTHQKLVERQFELEQLYSKNQCIPRLRAEFQNETQIDYTKMLTEAKIPLSFGFDVMVQIALHKRASLQTMVGLLFHHFKDAQLTADMLAKCAFADVLDWSPDFAPNLFCVIHEVSQDVQEDIDRFQYPLPMVVEPKEITNNRQTGYMINSGSVILRDNHTEDDVCLDHLNRMNAVRYTINMDTALMIRNKWRNLDKCKEGETREDFENRKKAFEKYDRCSKDVMALLMEHSKVFYLTHKYDKRGRTYCQGYHVSTQGTPWNKAICEFADKELVE